MYELNFFWSFPEYIHTHEAISLSTLMLPLRAMCLKKSLPFSICVVCVYVLDNMHNLTRGYYLLQRFTHKELVEDQNMPNLCSTTSFSTQFSIKKMNSPCFPLPFY